MSIALARAIELGFDTVACASTGNLAGAVAAHSAYAGLPAYVFVPADLEPEKILSAGAYGARSSACAATTTTSTGSAPRSRASARAGRS